MYAAATYGLHNVLEGVEADITRCIMDLGVHSHGQTLQKGRYNKRPFSADQGQLYRKEGKNGANDTRQIDINILAVGIGDAIGTGVHIVGEQDDGKKVSCQVERPIIALLGSAMVNRLNINHLPCRRMLAE